MTDKRINVINDTRTTSKMEYIVTAVNKSFY